MISHSHLLLFFLLILGTLEKGQDLNDTIKCVKDYINSFSSSMDSQIFKIFSKAFPNTLQTTIQHFNITEGNQYTYIITGDIQAMWLRDSTNQFLPYIRMPKKCVNIQKLSLGLLNAQAQFIMVDGYTNAFKRFQTDVKKRPFYLNDKTETLIMGIQVDLCRKKQYATQAIWQRKFEIDSLASFLRLSYEHYKAFDNTNFINLRYIKALKRIMSVFEQQINDEQYEKENNSTFYTFYRDARELAGGHIKPSKRTGMIKTGFRPSDDPNELAYNIPGNAMASTYLKKVAQNILAKIPQSSVFYSIAQILSSKMISLSSSIKQGIYNHGVITKDNKNLFAYEVNGFGDYRLIDDANLPSLLSLPYFQFVSVNDDTYKSTREYLLSTKNPYYFGSGSISGIGSSHTNRQYIWPLALMTQILTSQSDSQIRNCLDSLVTSAKNNLLHESFSVKNPSAYTRQWFAWANSFFGETIVYLHENKRHVLE